LYIVSKRRAVAGELNQCEKYYERKHLQDRPIVILYPTR